MDRKIGFVRDAIGHDDGHDVMHGVKIPDDVRFATVKNYGHGPALPISLTCVEFNPAEAGASVAQAALDFLGGKGFSHDSTSGFRYVIGDTFPEAKEGANR